MRTSNLDSAPLSTTRFAPVVSGLAIAVLLLAIPIVVLSWVTYWDALAHDPFENCGGNHQRSSGPRLVRAERTVVPPSLRCTVVSDSSGERVIKSRPGNPGVFFALALAAHTIVLLGVARLARSIRRRRAGFSGVSGASVGT